MISGLMNDHHLTVFAVACDADSSRNPITDSSMDILPKFFLGCSLHF